MKIGLKNYFAGYSVSPSGVIAASDIFKAIKDLPMASKLTGLGSFLGLFYKLGSFLPDLAHATETL